MSGKMGWWNMPRKEEGKRRKEEEREATNGNVDEGLPALGVVEEREDILLRVW